MTELFQRLCWHQLDFCSGSWRQSWLVGAASPDIRANGGGCRYLTSNLHGGLPESRWPRQKSSVIPYMAGLLEKLSPCTTSRCTWDPASPSDLNRLIPKVMWAPCRLMAQQLIRQETHEKTNVWGACLCPPLITIFEEVGAQMSEQKVTLWPTAAWITHRTAGSSQAHLQCEDPTRG